MIKPSSIIGKWKILIGQQFLVLNPAWILRHAEAFVSFFFPEGCPGFCNNNGRCTLEASGWHCICQPGWRGAGCHVAMETLCTDGKDNEGGVSARMNHLNVQTTFTFDEHVRCQLGHFAPRGEAAPNLRPRTSRVSVIFFQFPTVSCREPSPVSQMAWLTVWTLTAVCSFPVKTICIVKDPLIQWRCSVSLRLH